MPVDKASQWSVIETHQCSRADAAEAASNEKVDDIGVREVVDVPVIPGAVGREVVAGTWPLALGP